MLVFDAWQYAIHRAMHESKWLYNQFHSVHHRLIIPYAWGALYNHPLEAFLLDTIGSLITTLVAGRHRAGIDMQSAIAGLNRCLAAWCRCLECCRDCHSSIAPAALGPFCVRMTHMRACVRLQA